MGVVIGAYCFDVRIGTAFLAKISSFIQGIEYVHQCGWHRLWIELDSMAVLQCLLSLSYLFGVLLQDGITASSFFEVCASTALTFTGRVMRWRTVWLPWGWIIRFLYGGIPLLLKRLL